MHLTLSDFGCSFSGCVLNTCTMRMTHSFDIHDLRPERKMPKRNRQKCIMNEMIISRDVSSSMAKSWWQTYFLNFWGYFAAWHQRKLTFRLVRKYLPFPASVYSFRTFEWSEIVFLLQRNNGSVRQVDKWRKFTQNVVFYSSSQEIDSSSDPYHRGSNTESSSYSCSITVQAQTFRTHRLWKS